MSATVAGVGVGTAVDRKMEPNEIKRWPFGCKGANALEDDSKLCWVVDVVLVQ